MPDFTGKVALITGADGGIGRVLCRHLAGRGAAIAAVDKRASVTDFVAELAADGVPARAAVVDVTDADGVRAAIGEIEAALGPVDVLVNNAGFAERESLEKTTAETWRIDIEGNLNGAYHCTAAVLPQMAAHHAGAIVNISSVNGLTSLGHPAYSAAKAGLISYTKAVAMELWPPRHPRQRDLPRHGAHADLGEPGRAPTGGLRTARQVVPLGPHRRAGRHRQGRRVPGFGRRGGDHRRRPQRRLRPDGRQYRDDPRTHIGAVLVFAIVTTRLASPFDRLRVRPSCCGCRGSNIANRRAYGEALMPSFLIPSLPRDEARGPIARQPSVLSKRTREIWKPMIGCCAAAR